jgi:hypothetical protein
MNKVNLRSDSSLNSSKTGNKVRLKRNDSINLVHFMDENISNCFLSTISKAGKVSHYSEKGTLLSTINLEDCLSDNV